MFYLPVILDIGCLLVTSLFVQFEMLKPKKGCEILSRL